MDGNRRWAKKRFMPAALGHAAGAKRVREIVQACAQSGVSYLSLFAFSTENWKRPEDEVSSLMGLFKTYLQKEVDSMNAHGVRLRILGDTLRWPLGHAERVQGLASGEPGAVDGRPHRSVIDALPEYRRCT